VVQQRLKDRGRKEGLALSSNVQVGGPGGRGGGCGRGYKKERRREGRLSKQVNDQPVVYRRRATRVVSPERKGDCLVFEIQ
jgi:hypothetical protein